MVDCLEEGERSVPGIAVPKLGNETFYFGFQVFRVLAGLGDFILGGLR